MRTEAAKEVTGLILAGGHSSRFGADKARHPVAGRPMIAHVAAVVSSVCDPVFVSLGAETPAFEAVGVNYVRDQFSKSGPLAGIHAGLLASGTPWLLVVACDMPFLTPEALRTLLGARAASLQAVVAAGRDGQLHPLCACYRRDILPVVEAQLTTGRRAVQALLERLERTSTVSLPEDALRNINTPGDLDAGCAASGFS